MRGDTGVVFVLDGGLVAGGAERVAVDLMRHWLKSGRLVTLVTMRGSEHDFYPMPDGVDRVVLGTISASRNRTVGLIRNLMRLGRLRKAIRRSGAGVAVSFLTETNVRTVLACTGLGTRVVVSERNDPYRQSQRWPWAWLRKWVYRRADVVTVNSRAGLAELSSYVPPSRLALVPNHVRLPTVVAAPDRSTTILNVGRLVPQKDQALILDAFARLGEERRGWCVEILGEGAEGPKLRAHARRLGIRDAVVFRGLVPDPTPHYAAAAAFVLSSRFEGTPNALLEAMATGLPCLVADSLPGALEHVEPQVTGLVFRAGDAADLAAKLKRVVCDPTLRVRLGRAARERLRQLDGERIMGLWDHLLFR